MKILLPSCPGHKEIIFLLTVSILSVILWFIPGVEERFTPEAKTVPAEVLFADNSAIMTHGLVQYGSQTLKVKITDGKFQGSCFSAANELRGQMEFDKIFAVGDKITVAVPENALPEKTVLTAKDYHRMPWVMVLAGIFCLLLILFGSWVGLKALFSFFFSCLVIFKVVIPLVLAGYPASAVIFGSVILLTAVIIFLVAGVTQKAAAAFIGAVSGVSAGLLMAHLFGYLLHINGSSLPFVQALLYNGFEKLNLSDIFTGALILACSGAVMDLAMDIASAVEEVAKHSPQLTAKELIASGMRVGRSVVGTMTTTLLLAYSGGFLTLLMMFAVQGTAFIDIINNPLVAAEVIKTLIGSFSLVLVAPLTACAAGWIFAGRK